MGLEDISHVVETGDLLIVDGTNGVVIVNPVPKSVVAFREQARHETLYYEWVFHTKSTFS